MLWDGLHRGGSGRDSKSPRSPHATWLRRAWLVIGVVVSVLAALATLVVVLLVLRFPRVTGGEGDERVAAVTMDMRSRMDAMRRELSGALEEAQAEAGRSRHLGELAEATSLESLVRRALEAATTLLDADAALLQATGPDGRRMAANLGLSVEEARAVAGGAPEAPQPRVVLLSFRYPPGGAPEGQRPIRSALSVPVPGEHEAAGRLVVFSRTESRVFSDRDIRELEALVRQVGSALENARVVEQARMRTDLDPVTGLPNRARFSQLLEREVASPEGRRLALVLFDLDDFGAINRRLGHEAGDAALHGTAERVGPLLEPGEVLCRTGSDEFAAILPGATLAAAETLCRRLRRALAASPVAPAGRLSFSAAVAELDPDEDSPTFFQRAEETLSRARTGGGLILSAESWVVDF